MVTMFETIAGFATLAIIFLVGFVYVARSYSKEVRKHADKTHNSPAWKHQHVVKVVRHRERDAQAA